MKAMEHQNVMILSTLKSSILLQTQFLNAQIVSYFVTWQAYDTRLCGDFKAINKSATCVNLFRCGHLQQVEVYNTHDR